MRRLQAGQATVFRVNDSECYLFDDNFHGSRIDANFLFDLSSVQKKDLWILTDEALEDARWNKKSHYWFVVLAVSPAKVKGSNQWVKERNALIRYIRNWEWDEIVAAFTY